MPRHKGRRKHGSKSRRPLESGNVGRPRGEWYRRLEESVQEEDAVRAAAEVCGMQLRASVVTNDNATRFPHWRFLKDGFEVLHYWPTAQSYRTKDGAKGKVRDPHMALTLARWLLGEVDREAEAELIRAGVIGR